MSLFTLAQLEAAVPLVRTVVPPTPLYAWPLLAKRTGAQVWVKHENHTPIGAFKVRGGIVYLDALKRSGVALQGVVTATRGNHGQSIALAAARAGLPCAIFVPHGNSREKNAAMRAFGAELIVAGADFDESRDMRPSSPPSAATTTCPRSIPIWSRAWPPTRWRCSRPNPISMPSTRPSAWVRGSAA